MSSKFIHVAAHGKISFFFMAEQYSIVYLYHSFFIHSSVNRHLGCFHVLAIVTSTAMSIGVHVSFRITVFSGYMPGEKENTNKHKEMLSISALLFPTLSLLFDEQIALC